MSKTGTQKIDPPTGPARPPEPVVGDYFVGLSPPLQFTEAEEKAAEEQREANRRANQLIVAQKEQGAQTVRVAALTEKILRENPDIAEELERRRARVRERKGHWWDGFLLILLAGYCLYLGHPVYAVALVCFKLLYTALLRIGDKNDPRP